MVHHIFGAQEIVLKLFERKVVRSRNAPKHVRSTLFGDVRRQIGQKLVNSLGKLQRSLTSSVQIPLTVNQLIGEPVNRTSKVRKTILDIMKLCVEATSGT